MIAFGKFEKRRPTFFKFIPVSIKMTVTQLEDRAHGCSVAVILQMKDSILVLPI